MVAPCDSDGIALAYANAYDAPINIYKTTTVTISGVATTSQRQDVQADAV